MYNSRSLQLKSILNHEDEEFFLPETELELLKDNDKFTWLTRSNRMDKFTKSLHEIHDLDKVGA